MNQNKTIGEMRDIDIVEEMRQTNYEKFKTLVRMHLSFELDLNTDEFDLPCHEVIYYEKGKMKKWNRLSKKHKTTGCGASSGKVSASNSPAEVVENHINAGFIFHLKQLKEFLLKERNLTQEGIFRKTGSVSRQNELRMQIQNEKPLDLQSGGYSAHDCATVFKGYLAELPEPVLTDAHYPAHLQIAPLCLGTVPAAPCSSRTNLDKKKREQHLLSSVQLLLLLLPADNRMLMWHIVEILHAVAQHECTNKMSPKNLATLFAPHLICPRNLPPEALHYVAQTMSSIISYMISKGLVIFEIPAKLATDIRAYFLERKRKKTMSPEQTLDDSISDISTVNTVYTFVDREKTAAAHTANNTDTELAQLYAHIQSLPESSRKRRLIKQFNKQNGQGTPLQLVVMNRIKNSEPSRGAKSISDSIKKHIFHRGIMSRTPKRSAAPSVHLDTPNFKTKNPKLRVLFQSPASGPNVSGSSSFYVSPSTVSFNAQSCSSTNKKHALKKSISSSSLLLTSSTNLIMNSLATAQHCTHNQLEESCSNDGVTMSSTSISAPVSRTTSSDLYGHVMDRSCFVTPLKIVSDAAKKLSTIGGGGDKKSVAWDDNHLLVEQISDPLTPINQTTCEFKSRYKSEPNLSQMLKENVTEMVEETTPVEKSRSLTRKLIKGVSMGNLKFPFSTPESTKRLVRTVSLLNRRSSEDSDIFQEESIAEEEQKLDSTHCDDDTFEDESNGDEDCVDDQNLMDVTAAKASYLHNSIYRNLDLITSTPSLLLGRRSMSPITKSTQRMPKAMQESIMTPRSRKPVMMLTTTTGSAEQNQTINQSDLSSFREQDEDSFLGTNNHHLHRGDTLITKHGLQCNDTAKELDTETSLSYCYLQQSKDIARSEINVNFPPSTSGTGSGALTCDFKEYLLSRSVLTASPVDSSFSSQPDDFGSTQYIGDLDESQLSPSLLYCLDGNQPESDEINVDVQEIPAADISAKTSQTLKTNPFISLNARKRSASNDASSAEATENKENYENVDAYLLSKKLLIAEFPGETSF